VLTDSSSEDDWTGLGAGLGTRFALTDHFFLDVLVEYVTYLSKRLPASSLTTSDEITITQTQLISPRRIGASAALGLRF
jgi:opacity protein-like surface antigen